MLFELCTAHAYLYSLHMPTRNRLHYWEMVSLFFQRHLKQCLLRYCRKCYGNNYR
jgi:hypothetical protein